MAQEGSFFNLKEQPHIQRPLDSPIKICNTVLDCIGVTPLVRLNKIPQAEGLQCEMCKTRHVPPVARQKGHGPGEDMITSADNHGYMGHCWPCYVGLRNLFTLRLKHLLIDAKCEYLNPGGSVKDRVGYRMVLAAEKAGLISKERNSVLIVPSSGNVGIAVSLVSAVLGYRCIVVMSEKNSDEKVNTMLVLGAEVVRTPVVPYDDPAGVLETAKRLSREVQNAVLLDQYSDVNNPLTHYDTTGEEILWALGDDLDMLVMAAGTGGTLSGTAHKVKERCPKCEVVGVDPIGSVMAMPEELNLTEITNYEVEGVGYDFKPKSLHHKIVNRWLKVGDPEALKMARRLQREEGLLCGGSSGTAVHGAIQAARQLGPGTKCVVLLLDGMRNYMTKFVADQWMEARLFKPVPLKPEIWWWDKLLLDVNIPKIIIFTTKTSCESALQKLQGAKAPAAAVVDDKGSMIGILSPDNVRKTFVNMKPSLSRNLAAIASKKFERVDMKAKEKPTLGLVSRILDISPYVVVVKGTCGCTSEGKVQKPVGLFTTYDFVQYITGATTNL